VYRTLLSFSGLSFHPCRLMSLDIMSSMRHHSLCHECSSLYSLALKERKHWLLASAITAIKIKNVHYLDIFLKKRSRRRKKKIERVWEVNGSLWS